MRERKRSLDTLFGVGIAIGIAVTIALTFPIGLLLPPLLFIIWSPGITQLIYVVPLHKWYRNKGRPEVAKGLLIGASLVFLLNATCWTMFLRNGVGG